MTNRESFIETVEALFEKEDIPQEARDYLEQIKSQKGSGAVEITENGEQIIGAMQELEPEFEDGLKSRDIAEKLFTSSRSVSGAMRKLVSDGFVNRTDDSPIVYSLTEKGKTYSNS